MPSRESCRRSPALAVVVARRARGGRGPRRRARTSPGTAGRVVVRAPPASRRSHAGGAAAPSARDRRGPLNCVTCRRSSCRRGGSRHDPSARYAGRARARARRAGSRARVASQPARVELRPRLDRRIGRARPGRSRSCTCTGRSGRAPAALAAREQLVEVRAALGERHGPGLARRVDPSCRRRVDARSASNRAGPAAIVVRACRAGEGPVLRRRARADEPPQPATRASDRRAASGSEARRTARTVDWLARDGSSPRRRAAAARRTRSTSTNAAAVGDQLGARVDGDRRGSGAARGAAPPQSMPGSDDVVGDEREAEPGRREPRRRPRPATCAPSRAG